MNKKLDYKKEYKDFYAPKQIPTFITIPPISFVMIDGSGSPDDSSYQNAVAALYGISYTIKMGYKHIENYFDYVVPPLEGLWWFDDENAHKDLIINRDLLHWISMIRLPEFVTEDLFQHALEVCKTKKPELNLDGIYFKTYDEGDAVQILHIGPFSEEPHSIAKINTFIEENNLEDICYSNKKHHEIYLSDPRKTAPDKLKTIIRHPVKKKI